MKVFMCYSRKDEVFVGRLANDLRARGVVVWRDVDDIPNDIASNTTGWRGAVDKALRDCTHLIMVLSPDSVASPEVTAEWNYALLNQRPVIPVLHRECEIPYRLYSLNYWDVRQDYQDKVDQLAAMLLPSGQARTVQHPPAAPAAQPTASGGGRMGMVFGGIGIGIALLVVIFAVILPSIRGPVTTATPPPATTQVAGITLPPATTAAAVVTVPPATTAASTADSGGGGEELTATAAMKNTIAAVQQAVVAFDEQMRRALETGDTTGLSSVASGDALQERLDAVDILTTAGNCHWVYDQRGITPGPPVFTSSTRAEVRAEVDRDGTVRCDDGPRHDYDFTGPYLADYVVELLGGTWKVTEYANVPD